MQREGRWFFCGGRSLRRTHGPSVHAAPHAQPQRPPHAGLHAAGACESLMQAAGGAPHWR